MVQQGKETLPHTVKIPSIIIILHNSICYPLRLRTKPHEATISHNAFSFIWAAKKLPHTTCHTTSHCMIYDSIYIRIHYTNIVNYHSYARRIQLLTFLKLYKRFQQVNNIHRINNKYENEVWRIAFKNGIRIKKQ